MKNIFVKSKKYIIWFIIILLLLYFVPIPHRIKATVEGVMISGDSRETAVIEVDLVEWLYLLKDNDTKGTVTFSFPENGHEIIYDAVRGSVSKIQMNNRDVCWTGVWRYDGEQHEVDMQVLRFNTDLTKLYLEFDGEDIEFIAASDGSSEAEIREYFCYRD